jgi:hypothetical protein
LIDDREVLEKVLYLAYAKVAELADAPDLGTDLWLLCKMLQE